MHVAAVPGQVTGRCVQPRRPPALAAPFAASAHPPCHHPRPACAAQVFDSYLAGRAALGSAAPSGAAWVDCSTVLPSTTRRLAARAAAVGVAYCAGPVFGRPDAAAAGLLKGVIAGGYQALRDRIKALAGAYAGAPVSGSAGAGGYGGSGQAAGGLM